MDILPKLPDELKSKVFMFLSHPVADLVRDVAVENELVDVFNDLTDYFPELTFDDIVESSYYGGGDDEHHQVQWYLNSSGYAEVHHVLLSLCRAKCAEAKVPFTSGKFHRACHSLRIVLSDLAPLNIAMRRLMVAQFRITSGPPQNPT